ncbi:MAG: MFS transporter [Deltaproteobacteria bacterium]|nr:MFS transporter [Deltaproteobacteria bacterium]
MDNAQKFRSMDEGKVSKLHWKIMLISGMGFFTDAYDLFIIGVVMAILTPMWHLSKFESSLAESTALLASAVGALAFGRVADMLGRKRIYGIEVLVLAAGAIGCSFAPNIGWLIALRIVLGLGIGGDYPVSATIMSEYAGKNSRGMLVTLVFAMQAVGLILGPLLASALLVTGMSMNIVWRVLLAFGAVPALAVYLQRRKLKETPRYLAAAGKKDEDDSEELSKKGGSDANSSFWWGFRQLAKDQKLRRFLIGSSAAWFLMDAAYYANTISSPVVLSSLGANHTLLQKTLAQLGIFVLFAAPGYALAAWTMDVLGRKTIQCLGFSIMTIAFAMLALIPNLEKMPIAFLIIYGVSFFFTEFGPNATTFVYPSEIFPVRVRTTGHGIASSMGKVGGFVGVFLFPYLMHWKSLLGAESAAAFVSLLGLIVTWWLLPETKGKSLEEIAPDSSTSDVAGGYTASSAG